MGLCVVWALCWYQLLDGTWVVLVASGYNNVPNEDGAGGDGVGRLFVLDAFTQIVRTRGGRLAFIAA